MGKLRLRVQCHRDPGHSFWPTSMSSLSLCHRGQEREQRQGLQPLGALTTRPWAEATSQAGSLTRSALCGGQEGKAVPSQSVRCVRVSGAGGRGGSAGCACA